jgi:outer membrane protein OmpA-like peptidoglycan-associated protein
MRAAVVAPLIVLLCCSVTAADTGLSGFGFHIFQPTTDGSGVTTVVGSSVLPHKKLNVGVTESFEQNLIKAVVPATNTTVQLIKGRWIQDMQVAVGLWNWVDVGLGLPMALTQNGTNFASLASYRNAVLGDLRMDIKLRGLKDKKRNVGLAFLSRATFPTGGRSDFMGDDGPTWEGRLIMDKNFKWVGVYANGGYRIAHDVRVLSTVVGNRATFSGGVRARLPMQDRSWSLFSEVAGESNIKNRSSLTMPVEVRGGVEKKFRSGITLQLGGGRGLTDAFGVPSYRIYTSLRFSTDRPSPQQPPQMEPVPIPLSLYFEFNRSRIKKEDEVRLDNVAAALKGTPDQVVWVRGYTDNLGPRAYNRQLSKRRAAAVQKHLQNLGVAPSQIRSVGYGEEKPKFDNATRVGRSQNRRVDVGDE